MKKIIFTHNRHSHSYILVMLLLLIPLTGFSQWQAKMINSISGEERIYKVYSKLDQYRYEFSEEGMKGVVIVNPAINQTAILLPDDKKVHYTTCDGMMSSMNDPVQAYSSTKKYGEEKIIGNESIAAYDCIKKTIFQGEQKLFTLWFSEELNFPVRIEGHFSENAFMQLENIQKWDVDPSMFIIPEDYIEVDDELRPVIPEPPPPDKWERIETMVPFDMAVSRGTEVFVSIDVSVYYKMIVENTGDMPAKFSYHSFRDGKELSEDIQGPAEYRTKRLYMGEDYNMTLNWKAGQTILIKVYEGNLNLKIYTE